LIVALYFLSGRAWRLPDFYLRIRLVKASGEMSEKQKAILDFIREYLHARKYSPSIREICEGTGITSTSYMVLQLNHLQNAGLIERDECVSRSIRLTGPQPGC
jgi:repressor LexA